MAHRGKPLLEDVIIEKFAAEGNSLAYVNEKVLFVANTVPGDIVDVQVTRKRKSFMEGYVTRYKKMSDMRCEPMCSHFGICGGCKWQSIPYEKQLELKQNEIEENLSRIGKVSLAGIHGIIGSEKTREYRNKLEFTFCDKRYLTKEEIGNGEKIDRTPALGFHIPGMFNKVLDIDRCYLQGYPSNEIRNFVKQYALEHHLSFYNINEHCGMLRNITVRTSSTGDVMVILSFSGDETDKQAALLDAIKDNFPGITSLMYVINNKLNDTIGDLDIKLWYGKDHIFEKMGDLKFKIGPKSFYQTNSEQAFRLYSKTREFAALSGKETVYDLYTGTGTIANFVAGDARKVVGIEYVAEAIEDAKVNSEINGITNTSFYAGDMKDVLNEGFIAKNGHPDVIITDPPRAGMHKDVVDTILKAAPDRIVYVSCNSATQSRDLNLLDEAYRITAIQPVDMFPHTHHVENIVALEKR